MFTGYTINVALLGGGFIHDRNIYHRNEMQKFSTIVALLGGGFIQD